MATPSDEFTGDDFEAADGLLLIKITDPDELRQRRETGGRFFPRWLNSRRRSVPKDDGGGNAARLSPTTPLSISSTGGDKTTSPPSWTSPIGGDPTASRPLPPLSSVFSTMPPLPPSPQRRRRGRPKTRKADEILNEMVKERKQMITALTRTKLNLQRSLAEAQTRYRILMEENSGLRVDQCMLQLYGFSSRQTLDLFPVGPNLSMRPTFPVGPTFWMPEVSRTVAASETEWLRQRWQEQLRATEQGEARRRRMELQSSRPWP